jgi:hypothetical protein
MIIVIKSIIDNENDGIDSQNNKLFERFVHDNEFYLSFVCLFCYFVYDYRHHSAITQFTQFFSLVYHVILHTMNQHYIGHND